MPGVRRVLGTHLQGVIAVLLAGALWIAGAGSPAAGAGVGSVWSVPEAGPAAGVPVGRVMAAPGAGVPVGRVVAAPGAGVPVGPVPVATASGTPAARESRPRVSGSPSARSSRPPAPGDLGTSAAMLTGTLLAALFGGLLLAGRRHDRTRSGGRTRSGDHE